MRDLTFHQIVHCLPQREQNPPRQDVAFDPILNGQFIMCLVLCYWEDCSWASEYSQFLYKQCMTLDSLLDALWFNADISLSCGSTAML